MSDPLDRAIFGDDRGAEAISRRQRRRAPRPPAKRTGRKVVVVFVALALVTGAGVAAFTVLKPLISKITGVGGVNEDMDFTGPGEGEVKIAVAQGQTGDDIATTLRDNGVTKTRTAYLEAAKGDPAAASRIQPGTYTLKKGMRGVDAFKVISNPANVVRNAVTLPEGLWASETFARLSSFSGIPVADYEAAAKDAAAIGLPAAAGGNVEGWLSPTTYEFPENSTATQQLAIMVKRTVDELARANVAPDQQQRILTLASIVEGEVNAGTDRGKVARVIENRLVHIAQADLVLALYNPASRSRTEQIGRAREVLLAHRRPETVVVVGRDVGRSEESLTVTTLGELDPASIDMKCLVLIGASGTRVGPSGVWTPRFVPEESA